MDSIATGAPADIATAEPGYAALTAIRTDYRWTPACQRAFLEELAATGSVTRAVAHVGKTPRGAYALRNRYEGAGFRLGWDAAILIARAALADMLMDRAINGFEERYTRSDDGEVVRHKLDNRLSMGLLARLDRMAVAEAARGSHLAQVQLVVQDFERFLDLVARGGTGADAALFCMTRCASAGEGADGMMSDPLIDCELARISAENAAAATADQAADAPPDPVDADPEIAAAEMSVWYDEDDDRLHTDFPPASEADAAEVEQFGVFGMAGYWRTLTAAEIRAHDAAWLADTAALRTAALAARQAWFATGLAA